LALLGFQQQGALKMQDRYTVEDDIFNQACGAKPYKSNGYDPIDNWLSKNTGMFGETPSYEQLCHERAIEFAEQVDKVSFQKRFIYKVWYEVTFEDRQRWQYIGEHDVNDKEELQTLIEKLERKHSAQVKTELYRSKW
jgi:hypothetical protein